MHVIGQLVCVGSPLFLKKTYGVGYTMVVTKDGNFPLPHARRSLTDSVVQTKRTRVPSRTPFASMWRRRRVSGALCLATEPHTQCLLLLFLTTFLWLPCACFLLHSDVGTEVSFQLPLAASAKFPALLKVRCYPCSCVVSAGLTLAGLSLQHLDDNGPALGVANYGLSGAQPCSGAGHFVVFIVPLFVVTTLEEVFLKVCAVHWRLLAAVRNSYLPCAPLP